MFILSLVMMFGGIIFYIIALNFSVTSFRKLVDYEYLNHKEIWEADGKPRGGKITVKDLSFFGSDLASNFCAFSWAFRRPTWLPLESDAERHRIKMIRWFLISFIGFFSGAGGMLLFGITLKNMG
jgi:hypothetical protein